jgi:hypothetical protein
MRRRRKQQNMELATKTVLSPEDLSELYKKFIIDLPDEALRVETLDSGKDLYIYGYQYIVNVLNEVVGLDHWHYGLIGEPTVEKRNDTWWTSLYLRLSLGNWVDGEFKPLVYRDSFGSGISETLGNSKKGALTNALKKAAAMYGIGKKAYEGLLEEFDLPSMSPDKITQIEVSLTKEDLEITKTFEKSLLKVKDDESLTVVKAEYLKLKSTLNDKQSKYIEELINKLERRLNRKSSKGEQLKLIP